MTRRYSVALLIETSKTYGRGLLRGISRYARAHQAWSMFIAERGLDDPLPAWFRRWRGDGVILRSANRAVVRAVRRRGAPVVYLGERHDTGLPMLHSDDRSIARQAAEHFLERGFTAFAFVGLQGAVWSDARLRHFRQRLQEAGRDCTACQFDLPPGQRQDWLGRERELTAWLRALPKPAAVLACYDVMGIRVLDACRGADIAVPEQLAVLGVDNDPLLCTLANPPLSSVAHDLERLGYEAAELLQRLMDGQAPPHAEMLLESCGVVCRQSSDILAIDDELVSRALRFIREHACEGIDAAAVVRAVGTHPLVLKRRFEKALGRSPKAEILRLQLGRVKQLLRDTDFTLERIARLAGFRHPEYLNVIFKRKEGQTPGQFRAALRRGVD